MSVPNTFIDQTLANLSTLSAVVTRSITPENPTGAPGEGGKLLEGTGAEAARELGQGWKQSPSVAIQPGEIHTLADIDGSGKITNIWATAHKTAYRALILRIYWDGDTEPAVEVPLGDFFCQGWGEFAQVNSLPIAVNPNGGFNSYWPMPFSSNALITIENTLDTEVFVYYQVTYDLGEFPTAQGYFHAQWRRSNPLPYMETHTLLEGIIGRGQYVGTYMAWGSNSKGWWGEGEVKFYIDSDTDFPTICGTGTEDYFGGAWNFDVEGQGYTAYSTPYLGMPQVIRPDGLYSSQQRFGMYRWHVVDAIRFSEGLPLVTVQALGWRSKNRYLPLQDDIASTSIFYLDKTSTTRPKAPTADSMECL